MAWTEIKGPKNAIRVRVFIERPGGGAGLADCERVNGKLSALFDLEDPIPGPYTLEVSTPGLDRPLRSLADCRRFLGQRIRVKRRIERPPESGPKTVVGVLRTVEDEAVCLEAPEGPLRIEWGAVLAARLDPDLDALLRERSGAPRPRWT